MRSSASCLACVCGSDLWYYRGDTDFPDDSPIGHEFIGVVEQVGDDVKTLSAGDFVVSPFAYSDGTCPDCQVGMTTACAHGGFIPAGNGDGGQGELVRVPLADGTLVTVPGAPSDYSDEVLASLLALSDVMGTGQHAAVSAQVEPGDTVAVVGDGAVGLCAVIAAKQLGAERIIALSRHPDRQRLAREFGATDIVDTRGDAGGRGRQEANRRRRCRRGAGVRGHQRSHADRAGDLPSRSHRRQRRLYPMASRSRPRASSCATSACTADRLRCGHICPN